MRKTEGNKEGQREGTMQSNVVPATEPDGGEWSGVGGSVRMSPERRGRQGGSFSSPRPSHPAVTETWGAPMDLGRISSFYNMLGRDSAGRTRE